MKKKWFDLNLIQTLIFIMIFERKNKQAKDGWNSNFFCMHLIIILEIEKREKKFGYQKR